MAHASPAAGFTLIEVIVALAIVAVTTLIAVSSYRNHVLRSHRAEAAQALATAAAEQEKFHLTHGRYGDRLDASAGDDPPGLPVASRTPGGRYTLAVESADAWSFRLVATTGSDRSDPACHRFGIDETGRRTARDATGADSTARCW